MDKLYINFLKFCELFSAKGNHKDLNKIEVYRVLLWLAAKFYDRQNIPIQEIKQNIVMCSSCIDSVLSVLIAGNIIGVSDDKAIYLK